MKRPEGLNLPLLPSLLKMSGEGDWGEDWDLILADSDWVEKLIGYYETESLNEDEKNILMQLIMASYDERLQEKGYEPELEQRLANLLKRDVEIHKDTFAYWMRLDEPESEGWKVTLLLRKIWFEHEDQKLNTKN